MFPLTPLVACWRYEPREHPRPLALARPAIPPSPLSDRVGYSDHVQFRGYLPVHWCSGLQPPCLRFAAAVTGRHARLGTRLLARLCRRRHLRRLSSTRLQGATLIEPDMRICRIRLSDKTSRSRVRRPLQFSEHVSELIGFPISRSFATSCVCLELRSLPSTGVTRPQRYYEPLRHPKAPGLSLTGVRLIIPDHAMGLPVLRALSLCTCCRHYPGAAAGRTLRSFTQPYQPSPEGVPGRPAHRPFRGLLSVHSRCGPHTRAVTYS